MFEKDGYSSRFGGDILGPSRVLWLVGTTSVKNRDDNGRKEEETSHRRTEIGYSKM